MATATKRATKVALATPKRPSNRVKPRVLNINFPSYREQLLNAKGRMWSLLAYRLISFFSGELTAATAWATENKYKPGTLLKKGNYQERFYKLLFSISTYREAMKEAKAHTEADIKKWEEYGRLIIAITEESHPGWCSEGPTNIKEAERLIAGKPVEKNLRINLDRMAMPPLHSEISASKFRVTLRDLEGNILINDVEVSDLRVV
jgi:hypothetical protein